MKRTNWIILMAFLLLQVNAFAVSDTLIRQYKNHISLAAHLTQINLSTTLSNSDNKNRIEYKTETTPVLNV